MYSEENRFKTFEESSNQNTHISSEINNWIKIVLKWKKGKERKDEHTLDPSKDKTKIISSMNNVPKRLIRLSSLIIIPSLIFIRYQFNTQRYKKRALDVHRKIGRSFYSKRM